jgi:ABC-type Mn2+/Zn2+ transport system ATPase subunit
VNVRKTGGDVGDPVVRVRRLHLALGGDAVLRDVDLEVREGEFCFLLGPNGAGKTTLLRSILGEIRPLAGEVWLHPELAARSRIGFVPQRCDLNRALPTTVREFVSLGLVGARADEADETARLHGALERAGLAGREREDYWALSGGERQRALLARALVRRPRLLVLDEPTTSLDVWAEARLLELLAELNRAEHVTILIVTHDIELAARYATRVAVLRGATLLSGSPADLLSPEMVRQVFGVPHHPAGSR